MGPETVDWKYCVSWQLSCPKSWTYAALQDGGLQETSAYGTDYNQPPVHLLFNKLGHYDLLVPAASSNAAPSEMKRAMSKM